MISVEEALDRIRAGLTPLAPELIPLAQGHGRVLAEDLVARRTQPPFAVSAMDGYAVRAADLEKSPAILRLIGSVPAGGRHDGLVGSGETVRIFTGAPVPDGADAVLIQEDTKAAGDSITALASVKSGQHIRQAGIDFVEGRVGIAKGTRLSARHLGLAAGMNRPWLMVHRQPRVAILPTGDEVALPGDPVGPNQIVSSNGTSLGAMVAAAGGIPIQLGIGLDNAESLRTMAAGAVGADMLVTIGGASVGEHDLIRSVLGEAGLELDFWKIAMRPGKPLMHGRIGAVPMLGLPGNPVSAIVCALLFLVPALEKLQGLPGDPPVTRPARAGAPIKPNDVRQDYLRATLALDDAGYWVATPFGKQDSSMMSSLAAAGALIVRPPHADSVPAGGAIRIIPLGL